MNQRSTLEKLANSPPDFSPRRFRRAATQRFQAASILLNAPVPSYLDAVYLGGYAAECALKSLILARVPETKWPDIMAEIGRGAHAHDLDSLRRTLELQGCHPSPDVKDALRDVGREWTTQLRYIGALVSHKEATAFLERVEIILRWVERSQ